MRAEQFADLLNTFNDSVTEFLLLEMRPHCIDNALPEFFAALLVNRLVADHGEFMGARRNENEHAIALACFVHAEAMKFLLRNDQWIGAQLAALDVNANLAGRRRFCGTNRVNDLIVLKLA